MNRTALKIVVSLTSALPLSGLTGCVVHDREPRRVVVVEPPPPREEIIIERERPSADHVFIKGHWDYRDGRYEWEPGRWVTRPHHEAVWVEGRHERREHGYIWIEGHWR